MLNNDDETRGEDVHVSSEYARCVSCALAWLYIHAEGKVAESEPVRRADVVREQDKTSVDELPARGQTRQVRAQWMTRNTDTAHARSARPQQVALYDDDVRSQPSVVENEPISRRLDVVREQDDTEADVLLRRGFTRHLAGFWSHPRSEQATAPRETVDLAALRGTADTGVRENQPQRLEGVVRADDPGDDDWLNIEHGMTRSLTTHWSTQHHTQTTKQPFCLELDVDPNETAVFENEPRQLEGVVRCTEPVREVMGQRGQIRHISMKYADSPADTPSTARPPPDMIAIDLADGPAVLENEPAAVDPSVVRSVWTDVDDGAPQPGTTRSMLQRWTSQQDVDRSSVKPAWLADWETTPEGSGVFENTPNTREDVIREQDYEPEMISVRQTRRARAMWSQLEREDSVEELNTKAPEVRSTANNCVSRVTH